MPPVPMPPRQPAQNTARAVARALPGMQQGGRAGLAPVRKMAPGGPAPVGEWVVVEPAADIAAKSHPYISFDPAG